MKIQPFHIMSQKKKLSQDLKMFVLLPVAINGS